MSLGQPQIWAESSALLEINCVALLSQLTLLRYTKHSTDLLLKQMSPQQIKKSLFNESEGVHENLQLVSSLSQNRPLNKLTICV
jgi:hypothetical protein